MKEIITSKALNRAFLALKSFKRAKALLPIIKQQTDENAKSALFEALCVAYAKPFTQSNKIGSLERTEVPQSHLNTHDELITFRHKVAAHSDGDHQIQNESMNCVYFVYDENGLTVEEYYPYPNESFHIKIDQLIEESISELSLAIEKCMSQGPPSTYNFSNGRYKLDIDKGNRWFISQ